MQCSITFFVLIFLVNSKKIVYEASNLMTLLCRYYSVPVELMIRTCYLLTFSWYINLGKALKSSDWLNVLSETYRNCATKGFERVLLWWPNVVDGSQKRIFSLLVIKARHGIVLFSLPVNVGPSSYLYAVVCALIQPMDSRYHNTFNVTEIRMSVVDLLSS